jgi:peptide/nickel transport system permease protein
VLEYFFRRLFISAITLLLISVVVFSGLRLIPGDPARTLAGAEADESGLEEIRERYGLNDPIYVQYLRWVGLALRGDLGESIRTREDVARTVLLKLPITIQLSFYSILVAIMIAIPSGVFSALRRNSLLDYLVNGLSLSGLSIPNFWLGILLILLFSVRLGWLPASGHVPLLEHPLGNLRHLLMPSFVLGTGLAAVLMRQTRNSMIEVLSADYIRTAYSKGLARRTVVVRHALRNGLIPVVTILGLQMGTLISGAVVTEQIFVVPGFGRLIVEAVFTRDYPLVQGVILITAAAYVLINFLVDLSYSALNPRIRVKGGIGDG